MTFHESLFWIIVLLPIDRVHIMQYRVSRSRAPEEEESDALFQLNPGSPIQPTRVFSLYFHFSTH